MTWKGGLDNLFLIRELTLDQKFEQRGRKPLLFAFLDIKKAFDRVSRDILWDRLFKMGISRETVKGTSESVFGISWQSENGWGDLKQIFN